MHIRRVEFTGLGERSRRLAELRRAGGTVARAMMGTLPKQGPRSRGTAIHDPPRVVLRTEEGRRRERGTDVRAAAIGRSSGPQAALRRSGLSRCAVVLDRVPGVHRGRTEAAAARVVPGGVDPGARLSHPARRRAERLYRGRPRFLEQRPEGIGHCARHAGAQGCASGGSDEATAPLSRVPATRPRG